MPIDQDGFVFSPLVLWTEGEVMGNYVSMSVRACDGFCVWMVRVETTLDELVAESGVTTTLKEAQEEAGKFACAVLDGNFPIQEADDRGIDWYTDIYGDVRCAHCGSLYTQYDDLFKKGCSCETRT